MYDQYYWGDQVERLNIGRSASAVTTEGAGKVSTLVRTDGARVVADLLVGNN